MYKNRLLQLVAVVVVLMAVAASGIAASSAYAAKPEVNFKAKVSGTAIVDFDAGTIELAGTGKADHLKELKSYNYEADGRVTGDNTDVLTETMDAGNGDTLTILCEQVIEEISPGVIHGTDTWTVIGGTGRFSNAEGSGTGDTYVDLNVGEFSKVLKGTIVLNSN